MPGSISRFLALRSSYFTDHYKELASKYDTYSLQILAHHAWSVADAIMQCVSIDHEDLVADIGAGTGEIAHHIWKSSQLKNPLVCVEPSSSMLEILKEKDGVDPVQACIEDFFS